jgi:hypothetical protein
VQKNTNINIKEDIKNLELNGGAKDMNDFQEECGTSAVSARNMFVFNGSYKLVLINIQSIKNKEICNEFFKICL